MFRAMIQHSVRQQRNQLEEGMTDEQIEELAEVAEKAYWDTIFETSSWEGAVHAVLAKAEEINRTWTKVSDAYPEPELAVIAYVREAFGNPENTRRIRAYWIPRFTVVEDGDGAYESGEYDEATDEYYIREGWYEHNEFEETHWKVDGNVTHWMPLPDPPLT